MTVWSTISRIGRLRLGKMKEAFKLGSEIVESLSDEQKASLMAMATPEQLEKGFKLYEIWNEFWKVSEEEKKG